MSEMIIGDRAMRALDEVIPPHARKAGPRSRRWTMASGEFTVEQPNGELGAGTLQFTATGDSEWSMTVPRTTTGLDVLVLAMLVTGAIDPGPLPVDGPDVICLAEPEPGYERNVTLDLGRPLDRVKMTASAAYALGAHLVLRAGRISGRWLVSR